MTAWVSGSLLILQRKVLLISFSHHEAKLLRHRGYIFRKFAARLQDRAHPTLLHLAGHIWSSSYTL